MKNTSPLITIVISAYNSEDTISAAVNSALEQDWPNFELIVADDGLQDNTADIVREIIKGHDNARLVVYDANKGFAGSLNTLIGMAKGEFFAIFDDDDISAPDRIRRQYERITAYENKYNAKWVICHTARTQRFDNGHERYEPTMGTDEGAAAPRGEQVADRILFGKLAPGVVGSCANCSRMARTSLFREMKGYDASMRRGEDTDFNIRLALMGGHFVGIADPLVTQKMTMGQEKHLDREHDAELIILDKYTTYLEGKNWNDFCRDWLEIRYDYYNNKWLSFARRILTLALLHPIKLWRKLYWALPAANTRHSFKKWHHQKLG